MTPVTALQPTVRLAFDPELVRKYDVFGPRYTSYPTADRFHGGFRAGDYVRSLATREASLPLSLYVHLPFCSTICYYCACNKVITKDHGRSAKYIRYLGREISMVAALIEGGPRVEQLHWGGGTPTFLAPEEMKELMAMLRGAFAFAPQAELSIEVDPRKVDASTIALLAELGFNRISVGVQDFDPKVQQAVNRLQSESETRAVIDAARDHGFRSVNVDLIYGLPRQTVDAFATTLDKVLVSAPDRIALYSYAHVPHLFKPQRRIAVDELPASEVKLAILARAIEILGAAGYVYIGMDHFALPTDELAIAQRTGLLHRNFQGYSARPECDLVACGISAIGKIGSAYVQNVRTLEDYYARLDEGVVPVLRGVALDADDLVRRDVIQRLMCRFALDFGAIEAAHHIRFDQYFARELEALTALAADGLVESVERGFVVTQRGRFLVRSVAMVFDRYLSEQGDRARYSRVI
jgi:oxygen-independent coproporphyrinogen-3 oxidase